MLDLFAGIGGFHKGFEEAGWKFDWVGFSEIDKYASAVYRHRFPDAKEIGDITAIRPERDLPDHIDVLCGGFPCQSFSVAGKRKGWNDTRGTLFFEIERILRHYVKTGKPIDHFVLENVKGLLSHDSGRTFATIHRILTDLDYTVECQLLNTRWVLPQNRERIYIVGHFGKGSGSKIFPIGEADASHQSMEEQGESDEQHCKTLTARGAGEYHSGMQLVEEPALKQIGTIGKDSEATRVYDPEGVARTIKYGGGMGAKTGLYKVGDLKITAKKRTHDTPKEINEYLKANKQGKTIGNIARALALPKTQVEHYFRSDKYRAIPTPEHWLSLKDLLGFDDTYDKQVTDIYEKEVEFESSRRVYSSDGISKTVDTHETGYYQVYDSYNKNIRKDGIVGTLTQESAGRKDMSQGFKVIIPEATKKGYAKAEEGDSINLSVPNSKTRRGRVGKGEAQTLDTGMQQYTIQPVLTPNRAEKRQNGRRFKEDGEDMFTLTGQDQHGVMINEPKIYDHYNNKMKTDGNARTVLQTTGATSRASQKVVSNSSIRRLTPVECCRLQGFPDDWNEYGEFDGAVKPMSDTQRYKQLGNAVSVPIVRMVAEIIKKKYNEQ